MIKHALVLATLAGWLAFVSVPSSSADRAGTAQFVLPRAAAPGELSQYGHVQALVKKGARYELRFDPAFWLGGVTANRAAAEDKVVAPGEPVPNDYYVRDESRKLLTYLVPAGARVTVLVNPSGGLRSVPVAVAELAQILKGRNPKGRPLYDRSNLLGYWVLVRVDTVRSLDQQYRP